MEKEIRTHLNNPAGLEKLYQTDKKLFKQAFSKLYTDIKGNLLIDFWNERLKYESDDISRITSKELSFVVIASIIAGVIAKLPALMQINENFFYTRNVGFIIFPMLSAYFIWKNKLSTGKIIFIIFTTLATLIFINLIPNVEKSDTLLLSCIHLIICLWSLLGFAFVGDVKNNTEKRLGYLKYNGDLIVMTTLIVAAGALMTGITIGLFNLIGFKIEEFYFQNVVIFGLPAAPIAATYLIRANPQLVGKVSPVIARIFSPLVLIMLIIYLIAIIYSGKNPYNDREFLMIFNALLVGVLAIIFFSVAETSVAKKPVENWVLLLLSVITIIVGNIVLSAILIRIFSWGITPNRAAVLGANILILVNLLFITVQLFKVVLKKDDLAAVGKVISVFLPVYCLWAAIVTFLFPFIFGFK